VRKYKAFISYSHHDARWAKWLLNALESYKIPKHLTRSHLTERFGELPTSLSPIFRDREELPASDSIREEIFEALSASEYLIVICSPHAATSGRVREEISEFKRLKKGRNILCLIVDGEPGSGGAGECFPPPILEGKSDTNYIEPLAADARKGGDGKHNAMLKIAAGILNVKLSDLIIRDSARRQKKYTLGGIAAVAIIGIISALAIEANIARQEADKATQVAQEKLAQSNELIRFMGAEVLGNKYDNIDRLKIAEEIVKNFHNDDLSTIPEETRFQYIGAAIQLAHLYQEHNRFNELFTLLDDFNNQVNLYYENNPTDDNTAYLSSHLIFQLGDTYTKIADHQKSHELLKDHYQLTSKLHKSDPNKLRNITVLSNSYIYLAEQDLEFIEKPKKALEKLTEGLTLRIKAAEIEQKRYNRLGTGDAGGHYHLSRAQEILSPLSTPLESRLKAKNILRNSLKQNPTNEIRRLMYARSTLWLAETEMLTDNINQALTHFESAILRSQNLNKDLINPNYTAIEQTARARAFLAQIYIAIGQYAKAKAILDFALEHATNLYKEEPSRTYRKSFYYNTHLAQALYEYATNPKAPDTQKNLAALTAEIDADTTDYPIMIDAKNVRSNMLVLYGKALEQNNQVTEATAQWQKVIDLYDHKINVIHPRTKAALMEAHMLLGNDARAKEIARLLWEQEYREAHYMNVIKSLIPDVLFDIPAGSLADFPPVSPADLAITEAP
jgi:protein involved in temperature-dependent protein secretion